MGAEETTGVLFLKMETGIAGAGVAALGTEGGEMGRTGREELTEFIDPIRAESEEILSEILASSEEKSCGGGTEEAEDKELEIE